MNNDSYIAAVVQTASIAFNPSKTIDKLAKYTDQAASRGAKLIVFPEAFVGGHAKGVGFGSTMGRCRPEGREAFEMYYDGSIEVPSTASRRIGQIAGDSNVHLVTGAVERDGRTLYCTILFFAPDGSLLGKHRKLMPTGTERLIWGFGDGSTLPIFDTPVGKVGGVICWENYMPMLRMAMYAKGISVYCAPTADHRETWLPTMRHIAVEGRCFVLSACQFGRRSDFPADYPIDGGVSPDTILAHGGSCIIDPLGNVLCGPVFDEDLIHTAEIDLTAIKRAKFDFDVAGHSARPDLFKLFVDERPRRPVQTLGESHE